MSITWPIRVGLAAFMALSFVAVGPGSGIAFAQEERSEAERIRVAQELYSDAMKSFDKGDYEKAIEGFQAADALYPDPIFDYNIAVCWSALGEPMKALEAAERVADADLPPENAVKNRARILAFRRLRHARDVGRSVSLSSGSTTPPTTTGPRWSVFDGAALGVATVGVVGLGVTWGINARVAALAEDVRAANSDGDFDRARSAEELGRPLQRTGRVLLVVSSVTLVSGLTWLLVRRLGRSDDNASVGWMVGPAAGGVRAGLQVRF